jgi:hypothetical protein
MLPFLVNTTIIGIVQEGSQFVANHYKFMTARYMMHHWVVVSHLSTISFSLLRLDEALCPDLWISYLELRIIITICRNQGVTMEFFFVWDFWWASTRMYGIKEQFILMFNKWSQALTKKKKGSTFQLTQIIVFKLHMIYVQTDVRNLFCVRKY